MTQNHTLIALVLAVGTCVPATIANGGPPCSNCQNGQCSVAGGCATSYNGCCPQGVPRACGPSGCTTGNYGCGAYGCCPPARHPCYPCCAANDAYRQSLSNWHGNYYDVAWGTPVALVCPPNAGRQTKWAWGVTNTQVVPISHQFGRNYPGAGAAGGGAAFLPTPIWPNSTDQFGVYYVRGPW
jgi:hypothetical protein